MSLTELVAHISQWDSDRHGATDAQIQNVRQVRDRITAQDQLPPTQRWAPLIRQIDPRLVHADSWAPVAAALGQAHRYGRDLPSHINQALAQGPLDPRTAGWLAGETLTGGASTLPLSR